MHARALQTLIRYPFGPWRKGKGDRPILVGDWVGQLSACAPKGSGAVFLPSVMMAAGENAGFGGGSHGENAPNDEAPLEHYHIPVLLQPVLEALAPAEGKVLVDCTLGGGGHTEALLERGATVIGLDQDAEARDYATRRLQRFGDRFRAVAGNFRDLERLLTELNVGKVDGLLADIGVSSHQLDDETRGFSFQASGPLDMRMNPSEGRSAADWVNEESEQTLAHIFSEYGEEPMARRIARGIVERRQQRPFQTTGELAACIEQIAPRRGRKHPATRVFQALRIAVNDELGALDALLETAPAWLKPGGRLAIIAFHSLEDRKVKQAFNRYSTEWLDRPEWPAPRRNPDYCLRLLHRKPMEATEEEASENPRARSARLRAAERVVTP